MVQDDEYRDVGRDKITWSLIDHCIGFEYYPNYDGNHWGFSKGMT